MSVNRYELPAQYEHIPFPFDDVMRAGLYMQGKEDEAKQALIDLGTKQYRALPKDQEKLYAAQQTVNEKINTLYDKYKDKGYRQAANDIRKLRQELEQREGQFGDIGAMQRNLQSYQEYVKDIDEQYKKGTIDKDTRDKAIDY